MKLVEQELWQREEKGLIGILPVRDAAAEETASVGPMLSHGKYFPFLLFCFRLSLSIKSFCFFCLFVCLFIKIAHN